MDLENKSLKSTTKNTNNGMLEFQALNLKFDAVPQLTGGQKSSESKLEKL